MFLDIGSEFTWSRRSSSVFFCAGDAAQRRGDAERELAEAAQQKSQLEEKLAQVARNALLVLSNKEQIHREQMETERMQRVRTGLRGACSYGFDYGVNTNIRQSHLLFPLFVHCQ